MLKKKEIWYKNFIVYMEDGEIVRFEATKGVHVYDCAGDIIRFLHTRGLDEEYILVFNDKKLKISRFSSAISVANEFFGKKELGL